MSLLLLGGTADARRLCKALIDQGVAIIYSVAGLVRTPDVDCEVVSGGFTQFGGLPAFLKDRNITAILDATHPYAATMSTTAVAAAKACNILCWRFHRPAWEACKGDNWQMFKDWDDMLPALRNKESIFLTAGQIEQQIVDCLARNEQQILYRTAAKPKILLPDAIKWIKAIGPFDKEDELALMKQYQVDVLVSKNSGGEATVAKLIVARELGVPVFMLQRPELSIADRVFTDPADIEHAVMLEFGHVH